MLPRSEIPIFGNLVEQSKNVGGIPPSHKWKQGGCEQVTHPDWGVQCYPERLTV